MLQPGRYTAFIRGVWVDDDGKVRIKVRAVTDENTGEFQDLEILGAVECSPEEDDEEDDYGDDGCDEEGY